MFGERYLLRLLAAIIWLSFAAIAFPQSNWTSFRNGGTNQIAVQRAPTHWAPSEGIAWVCQLDGYGQSSPIVWDDTVFVTSSSGPFQEHALVQAIDLCTGKSKWTRSIDATAKAENYFRNSRAAPTGVVDQDRVISFFPSGDVVSIGQAGEVQWHSGLFATFGEVDNERGTAASLAQTDDLVFALVDHDGPSYLIALNKRDGSIAWRADRGERMPSWSSPITVNNDTVICSSADTVEAYRASDGELLWHIDGLAGNHIPSPTFAGDSVYIGSTEMYGDSSDPDRIAGSNKRIRLSELDSSGEPEVVWSAEHVNSYYSSPLVVGDFVYYVNKGGVLYCIDNQTGKQLYAKRIGNACWATGIAATTAAGDQYVYLVMKNGFTIVLKPGPEFNQVARNQLWDHDQMQQAAELAEATRRQNAVPPDQASPKTGPEEIFAGMPESALHRMFSYDDPTAYAVAMVEGKLLVRTGQQLYCITGQDSQP